MFKRIPLHWKIILALLLGVVWSIISAMNGWASFTSDWINPFGVIFIRLLKLIAVPLVLFSIIAGVSSLKDVGKLGRMGIKTLLIYLLTTVTAVSLGLLMVNMMQPGKRMHSDERLVNRIKYELWAQSASVEIKDKKCISCEEEHRELSEKIGKELSLEPVNPDVQTRIEAANKLKEAGPLQFLIDFVPENIFLSLEDMSLMLQVIFFALFFGVVLVMLPEEKAGLVSRLCDGLNEVFLKMVDIVMKAAPFFVFALTAGVFSKMAGNNLQALFEVFKSLGVYALTVILGLAVLLFGLYPLLMSLVSGKVVFREFFKAMGPAQLLAFSTSSSAATLPVTMECVNDRLKVPKSISDFVLPIGATVNMDGTSLYQAVAVVFLAQMHMIDLSLGQQLTIVFTATMASIGSAAVPSAGLVMLILVLGSVGLNPAWIAVLFPVDRLLDMCRTTINVSGDAVVSRMMQSLEPELD